MPVIFWNLTPLAGVIFLGWEPISVFLFYALETIVIGLFNVLKLLIVYQQGLPPKPTETGVKGLGIIPFFLFHYYFFVFIQLSIFLSAGNLAGTGFLSVFTVLGRVITSESGIIALAVFVSSNLYMLTNQYLGGVFRQVTMTEQMFEPYGRIFIQQFVIILGAMLFALTGNGYPVLIIFIGIKLYFDLLFKDLSLLAIARAQQKLRGQQGGME